MSKLNVEYLKSAVVEAEIALEQDKLKLADLKNLLHLALCEKSGLIGKIVSDRSGRIVVQDVEFNGDRPIMVEGKKLGRDNTASHESAKVWLCKPYRVSEYLNQMEGASA